jgi:hypothetical protein
VSIASVYDSKCALESSSLSSFVDILLSKAIGGVPTEPKRFWDIFERGIDPHVDDPNNCHHVRRCAHPSISADSSQSHSNVPDIDEDWPTLASVVAFRDRVRARLMRLYDELLSGKRKATRNIARTLVMTLEHEGFHVEVRVHTHRPTSIDNLCRRYCTC